MASEKLQQLLEEIKQKKAEQQKKRFPNYVPSKAKIAELVEAQLSKANNDPLQIQGIQYNQEQRACIDWLLSRETRGQEAVLVGAAGTGKTTAIKGMVQQILSEQTHISQIYHGTKYLQAGMPGILLVSYTNKAVAQIRRNMPPEFKSHCLTIHKLLEYEPVFYEIWDEEIKAYRTTMRFEPQRNKLNPLPPGIEILVIDESSMVDTELFTKLEEALREETKILYIGDINQLPPVFGQSILGQKLLEVEHGKLPLFELTQIYRQAQDSPIIQLAWKILKGQWNLFSPRTETNGDGKLIVPSYQRESKASNGKIKIIPWTSKTSPQKALLVVSKYFKTLHDSGKYIPEEDMILIPHNVGFGTIELNKHIAQWLGNKRQATVYEVISGITKHYLAVGDKVLHMKEEFIIEEIVPNGRYIGPEPKDPSQHLDRWGEYTEKEKPSDTHSHMDMDDVDALLESISKTADSESEDRFNQASHIVKIRNLYDPTIQFDLSTAGEVNNLLFAYALTVHKAQGSEWNKVWLLLHHSHRTMHFRELLYTAVTRAKDSLEIICEPDSLEKAIKSPRIKGNTIQEKLKFLSEKFSSSSISSSKLLLETQEED